MELLASIVFDPYIPGRGPTFALSLWDTGRRGEYGKHVFKYELKMTHAEVVSEDCIRPPQTTTLFAGEDYFSHFNPGGELHNLDSVIEGIMGFLTLRPGDTDEDYFKDYTPEQLDYCSQHAESLSLEVYTRYGEH